MNIGTIFRGLGLGGSDIQTIIGIHIYMYICMGIMQGSTPPLSLKRQ